MVPLLLELAQLVQQDSVPQVQVRRRRVEARLDPERPARLQFFDELGLDQQLVGPALDFLQDVLHRYPLYGGSSSLEPVR